MYIITKILQYSTVIFVKFIFYKNSLTRTNLLILKKQYIISYTCIYMHMSIFTISNQNNHFF